MLSVPDVALNLSNSGVMADEDDCGLEFCWQEIRDGVIAITANRLIQ